MRIISRRPKHTTCRRFKVALFGPGFTTDAIEVEAVAEGGSWRIPGELAWSIDEAGVITHAAAWDEGGILVVTTGLGTRHVGRGDTYRLNNVVISLR